MKKFLVVGANGFIGSNLIDHLSKGSKVVAIDRYQSKPIFKLNGNVDVVKADIVNDIKRLKDLTNEHWDGVVWAVGGVVPSDEIEKQGKILSILPSTIELSNQFIASQLPFIFLSSAGMLYQGGSRKMTESGKVDVWTWYGLQKLIIEKALIFLGNKYNNNKLKILRISSAYGARQPWDRNQGVVAKLFKSALHDESFTLFGSEGARRDFIFVDDLSKIIEKFLHHPSSKHAIYNVASGQGHTINEVRKIIENLSGVKIKIDRDCKRAADPTHIDISNARLLRTFKTFKFTPINQGLKETHKWYKDRL